MGDLYERVSTSGQLEHRYKVYVGSEQVTQAAKTEVSGVITDTSTVYLHSDHLGSATALTDETGELVEPPRSFRPFGASEVDVSASGIRAGFTGHEHDSELKDSRKRESFAMYACGILGDGERKSAEPTAGAISSRLPSASTPSASRA